MKVVSLVVFYLLFCVSLKAAQVCHNWIDIQEDPAFRVRVGYEGLYMRNTQKDDFPLYQQMFRDPVAMEKYMEGGPREMGEIDRRFQEYLGNSKAKNPWNSMLVYAPETKDEEEFLERRGESLAEEEEISDFFPKDRFVGHVMLEPGRVSGEAEISYVILPEQQGKGYCKRAVNGVFEVLIPTIVSKYWLGGKTVTQVYATARPDNEASVKVLKRNNFRFETWDNKFGAKRGFYVRRLFPDKFCDANILSPDPYGKTFSLWGDTPVVATY